MKRTLTLLLATVAVLVICATPAIAATSQDVTITATPSFIGISNSPGTYDFGVISASSTPNTGTGYFTVTNDSTIAIDITIVSNGWSGTSSWTWGAAGADTGLLNASGTPGGSGGSQGAGLYDVEVDDSVAALLADALGAATAFDWELQLEAPTSFSHGEQQTTTVTLTAAAN